MTSGAPDIKSRHQPGQAWLLTLLLVLGCSPPSSRIAPFRARPDSVRAGDLTGPFDGKVVDETTGMPIAGALVAGTWVFETGIGIMQPAGHFEVIKTTDATGGYVLPAISDVAARTRALKSWKGQRNSVRLTAFHLVIYKKGYAAYRSDRRFSDFGPRLDFVQHANRVPLSPWRNDMSHVRHLRYVGGGAALAALTRWETDLAVAELGTPPPKRPEIRPESSQLVAAQLLSEETIARVTGFGGPFKLGPLKDKSPSSSYSSQHFQAVGQSEAFDLAVRMWQEAPEDAQRRFDGLAKTLPGVEPTKDVGTATLRTRAANILGIAFIDRARGVVVLMTCGTSLCTGIESLLNLARAAHQVVNSQPGASAS